MAKSLLKRIYKYNRERNPELVKLKYQALTESPFRFFRGTCHLFYEDMPKKSALLNSPHTWICGDLHMENFGSFRGDDRLAYFDMNDFDESFIGPCLLDIARCCTSVFLAGDLVKLEVADCYEPVQRFLKTYGETLAAGKIRSVKKETATGAVKELLDIVSDRDRKELLDKHVDFDPKKPLLRIDKIKYFAPGKPVQKLVKQTIEQWAEKNTKHPEFFDVFDVAIRQIGSGSLGIERYLALVNGKGGPEGYHLLDLKEALPPSALKHLRIKQPGWNNEAQRLIAIQQRVQADNPAFLNPIKIGSKWFVMKAIQPSEDKIDFTRIENKQGKLTELLEQMAHIVAWNNLRCGGRQGSAIADTMIRFGEKLYKIEDDILEYAEQYADQVRKYYKEYLKEYKTKK